MWDKEAVHGNRSEHRSSLLQVSWFVEWEEIIVPTAPFFLDQTKIPSHKKKKKATALLFFFFSQSENVWLLEKVWRLVGKRCKLESSHAGDSLQRSSSHRAIEEIEVHRHLSLVSLGSWITAFLPSVLSTEIVPDMGLVLTGSEDPDETHSWPWCWTANVC